IDGVHRINLALLLTPHSRKKTHPILAHDLSDARVRPAILLQRRGEIGEMLDAAKLSRHDDVAEGGKFPPVAFVMRDVAEKLIAVTLGEIGSDPDLILAHDIHNVIDGFHDILESSVGSPLQKRREHRDAHEAPFPRNRPELLIRLVAWVLLQ